MKKIFLILAVLFMSFALISCQKKSEKKVENNAPVVEAPKGLEGITVDQLAMKKCAGCAMDMTEHAIVDTMTYEGKLYGFCSADCKEHFKSDPAAALEKMNTKEMEKTEQ